MENSESIRYKKDWRLLNSDHSELIPIYMKDWYWDAVCEKEDDWQVICIYDKNGNIDAAFPFVYTTRKGMKFVELPWQVPCAGIWLQNDSFVNKEKAINHLRDIVNMVVKKLPSYDYFYITFNNHLWTWHPFYWLGFDCIPVYTSIINPEVISESSLKEFISKKRRKRVNQAERLYKICINEISAEDYWNFMERTYRLKNKTISFEWIKFKRLYDALMLHDACDVRTVYDENGELVAENVILKDSFRMYDQFGTHLNQEHTNAKSYAIYDSILKSCEIGLVFDFEGSMIPGVFEFNTSWNPDLEIHYAITKSSKKYKFLNAIRTLIGLNR